MVMWKCTKYVVLSGGYFAGYVSLFYVVLFYFSKNFDKIPREWFMAHFFLMGACLLYMTFLFHNEVQVE